MADHPILFSAPMIRALLDGRKTQTRRILKMPDQPKTFDAIFNDDGVWSIGDALTGTREAKLPVKYKVGDRLWCREAHALLPRTAYRVSIGTGTIAQIEHPTDGYSAAVFREGFDRSGRPIWRPSIHMPRWASRLTLIVTDVRVQRLQEIREADAIAEGIDLHSEYGELCANIADAGYSNDLPNGSIELAVFRRLWDHINGPGAWSANPWVVAYSFTAHRCNIDQMEAAHG